MRRLFTLALLFGGMRLILPLGSQGQGSQALLAFGFLILAAYTVGELATAVRVPRIVGYMVAGVVFGPHVLEVVSAQGVTRLAPVSYRLEILLASRAPCPGAAEHARRAAELFPHHPAPRRLAARCR